VTIPESNPEKMPLWLQMFQENVLGAIQDVKDDIKEMVTRETFNEFKEQTGREIKGHREENKGLAEKLQAESTTRQASEMAAAQKALQESQNRQRVQSATNWQWVLIVGTVILNYLARFLPGGTP